MTHISELEAERDRIQAEIDEASKPAPPDEIALYLCPVCGAWDQDYKHCRRSEEEPLFYVRKDQA